jgi:lysophospholipase L1-like esterase
VSIDAGGTVWSDPVSMAIPAATQFWTRTYVTVTAGQTWRSARQLNTALGEAGSASTSETDLTTSGTISGSALGMAPCAIENLYVSDTQPVVLVTGDSIAYGAGDNTSTTPWGGFITRALEGVLPHQRVAMYGERLDHMFLNAFSRRRWPLATGCNIMLCEYPINDITLGTSLATIQSMLLTHWTNALSRGMRVWQTTITPVTTSTDSWATTANQTVVASNPVRILLNNWIRAGAPIDPTSKAAVAVGTSGALLAGQSGHPLYGYFEIADLVETARDSGIWKAAYTADGTHPTPTAHAAMAAGIDTTKLVIS